MTNNNVIKDFLSEMNEGRRQSLYFSTPSILRDAYDQPYLYILPQIKRLRESEHRQLYLDDDSLILRYMAEINPDEMAGLVLGDFPAIECLAYAVIEARDYEELVPSPLDRGHPIEGYHQSAYSDRGHPFGGGGSKEARVF